MIRTGAEIGRGLAPARDARPILPGERIHIIGAGGAGASAAALLAHRAGAAVTGCDAGGPSPYTAAIEAIGLGLAWDHRPDHVAVEGKARVDRVAVTKALTSVAPDHPELAAAREAGVPLEAWQQVVADAAATRQSRLIAVAGTHGKSTSAGWLVHVLSEAGRDPSAFVGALILDEAGLPSTARWGRGSDFVVEADEYAGNFDAYRPSVVLLLNAEWDHPDVFADEAAVLDAFEAWIRRMEPWNGGGGASPEPPVLVANAVDAGVQRIVRALADWGGRVVLAGAEEDATPVEVALPGRHNLQNASVVAVAARVLGVPEDAIERGLRSFPGVARRMELKGDVGGVVVLDDYGHHPTAIAATLEAVRERYPDRRVWAVYEPLTYHRTAAMLDAFADVLATADQAVIADIWAGRDPDTTIVSASDLADAINALAPDRATAPGSVEATADHLAARVEAGEVVLVMGGGRSYVIAERLVRSLEDRRAP